MLRGDERSYKDIVNSEPATAFFYEFEEPIGWATCHDSNNDSQETHQDGTVAGCVLEQAGILGTRCYWYDGLNDWVQPPATVYPLYFVDWGRELTIEVCLKVNAVGVWTDGLVRYACLLWGGAANYIYIGKSNINDRLNFVYRAGGVNSAVQITTSDVGWFHAALSVNVPDDEVRAYVNGEQQGVTQTGLGVWAGVLTGAGVGSDNAGASCWHGWLDNFAVTSRCLTAAEILERSQRLELA